MFEKILIKGTEAIAKAAIDSECVFYAGYPITPQTELAEYIAKNLPDSGGTFVQAESEIAAINMVYGASSTGARAMTSSSSPGISLKAEGISYLAACDLPCVIVNIVRAGPGLGNVDPAQSDYFQAVKGMGHGDYKIIVFAPSTVQETYDLTCLAFDKSDEHRVPCMIMGDGILGQMMETIKIKNEDMEKHEKKQNILKPWAATGTKLKRKKNVIKSISLNAIEQEKTLIMRQKKYEQIYEKEVMYEEFLIKDAQIILVSYGIVARIIKSVLIKAREMGVKAGLIRPITLWPFPSRAFEQNVNLKCYLVVELSMGQMIEDVRLSVKNAKPVHFYGRSGGVIPSEDELLEKIIEISKEF